MKTITIHVPEDTYRMFQDQAARAKRSASELIRDAMDEYYQSHFARSGSIFDAAPLDLDPKANAFVPPDLLEEMLP